MSSHLTIDSTRVLGLSSLFDYEMKLHLFLPSIIFSDASLKKSFMSVFYLLICSYYLSSTLSPVSFLFFFVFRALSFTSLDLEYIIHVHVCIVVHAKSRKGTDMEEKR